MKGMFIFTLSLLSVTLTGCSSFGPPAAFYEAQAQVKVAQITADSQPKLVIRSQGPVEFTYRGDMKDLSVIDEGSHGGTVARTALSSTLPALAPYGAVALAMTKIAENAGDRSVHIEGDGNSPNLSESREYNYASGDASSIKPDNRTDYANTKPIDNRSDYNNRDSTTPQQVVTQPPPFIVTQPEPVIVTQPVIEQQVEWPPGYYFVP